MLRLYILVLVCAALNAQVPFSILIGYVTEDYGGHSYHLVTAPNKSLTLEYAESTCQLLSGTLAEIVDLYELAYVRTYMKKYLISTVLLAGSDEQQEGSWVNPFTNTPLAFLKFNAGEPNGGRDENLLALSIDANYRMVDTSILNVNAILCKA